MPRLAFGVSYLGRNYCGLQRLGGNNSVASELEKAFAEIADHSVHIYAAGRTDRGVHALQQVAHFDTSSERENYKWRDGVNAKLPDDIRVLWIKPVAGDFHARFSAHSRRYAYLICNDRRVDAAMHGLCYCHYRPLDHRAMQQACESVSGEYDCAAFTTVAAKSRTKRRHIDWIRIHPSLPWILIDIQANAFLHRMARMLIAELLLIGEGKRPPGHLQQLLVDSVPRAYKRASPVEGLYLGSIGYSLAWQLPLQPVGNLWLYRLVGINN